jgi:hypothetical protein
LNACDRHVACLEEEISVDLVKRLPSVRIEQSHGCTEEIVLLAPGGDAAVSTVSQISEMA